MTTIQRLIALGFGLCITLVLVLVLAAAFSPSTSAASSETQTPSNGQVVAPIDDAPTPTPLPPPANHAQLPLFFNDDEDFRNGNVFCPRNALPAADQDNPQMILTNPNDGSTNIGTAAGMAGGITYVRLPFITLGFSEAVGPWLLNATDIVVRNTDTNQTFNLLLTLTQDRTVAQIRIQVRDLSSPFMVDTVPSGNYRIELTGFADLDGNQLVNADTCTADGTYNIDFSTP